MKTTLEIKKMGINGEGIGYYHRKIVFIKGAIVGEIVEVELNQVSGKNFYMGDLKKVIKPSSHRVGPVCHGHKECLGCQMQHLDYSSQLRIKKDLIKESIKKFTEIEPSELRIGHVVGLTSKQGMYSSVNLPIVDFLGKVTFGIYQRETKYLTVMTGCMKQHPLINKTLLQLEEVFNGAKCKAYNDKTREGLRFIKVRVLDEQVQLVIITGTDGLKEEVIAGIKKLKQVKSLFMSINTSRHQNFEEQGYKKIFGESKVKFMLNDQPYIVSIKSDLPENLEATTVLNKIIKTMVKDSQKIISLNSQLSLLETTLSQDVICIENKKDNLEDAKYNAKLQGKENIHFVLGNADKKVVTYAKKKEHDTYIIQNTKSGISQDLKDTLRLAKVQNVIYVSSSPSVLSKDLKDLLKYYTIKEIKAVDTHPYQGYVTTVAHLVRK